MLRLTEPRSEIPLADEDEDGLRCRRAFSKAVSQFPPAPLLSLAPGFSRVIERPDAFNRFSGLQAPKNR